MKYIYLSSCNLEGNISRYPLSPRFLPVLPPYFKKMTSFSMYYICVFCYVSFLLINLNFSWEKIVLVFSWEKSISLIHGKKNAFVLSGEKIAFVFSWENRSHFFMGKIAFVFSWEKITFFVYGKNWQPPLVLKWNKGNNLKIKPWSIIFLAAYQTYLLSAKCPRLL